MPLQLLQQLMRRLLVLLLLLGVLLHCVTKQAQSAPLDRLSQHIESLDACYLDRGLDGEVLVHLVRGDLDGVLS